MRHVRRINTAAVLAALFAAVLCCSCRRRPLEVMGGNVRIELNNDYSLPYSPSAQKPYHYSVLMFDPESGKMIWDDFCDEQGGLIRAVSGRFMPFVYSLGSVNTRIEGRESAATLRALSTAESVRNKTIFQASQKAFRTKAGEDGILLSQSLGSVGYEETNVIREPDPIFGGRGDDVDIPVMALSDPDVVAEIGTGFLLSQSRLTLYGFKHTEYIASVQVFITNLAGSKYLVSGESVQEPATIDFMLDEISSERIRGEFNHFGVLEDKTLSNTAYIVVTDTSGGKYLFVEDVTSQIRGGGESADIELEIDYDMPKPKEGGAGFVPVLDEWGTVIYDISLGLS